MKYFSGFKDLKAWMVAISTATCKFTKKTVSLVLPFNIVIIVTQKLLCSRSFKYNIFKYIPGYYAYIYLYVLYKHTVVGI